MFVEVWPLIADDDGMWLVTGRRAWRARGPVTADGTGHTEVERVLSTYGARHAHRAVAPPPSDAAPGPRGHVRPPITSSG
ncbi:hypothetical protein GCM10009682_15820 [Luedemannella flava]|uniref:Uncharacterized protein n=1 Tax=Luedemannella flava TaxID=349316 RepID=A0ABP4XXI1_9ACTN